MTGPELQKLRKRKKLSRRELAERIGYDHRTVEAWELGRRTIFPRAEKLIRLALDSGARR